MIQSLVRAMELLEVLNGSKSGYSIAFLSAQLDLPPSTIHRLLQTLCATKFVVKDEKSHDYKLGPALIPLGITARKNLHLQNAATPILERLVTVTKEDSYLVISTGFKGFVLEHIDGPSPLKVLEDFGFELDLHCGAIRKTLLAYQPPEFIHEYVESVVKSANAFPKVEPGVLLENLEKIRKEGVAVSHGDYISNSVGIGAPVFNSDGKIIASIGIITPASKIPDEKKLGELKQVVKSSARELSEMMGYFE
ncbi:MAG: IclR family transcriptional regulator [Fusobacteriaceae bacterium]|jgi:DNA-binding IclR family transcriptional regulator|nr:IclR family transcriptional regulator [Fusobacteriaceae bacterium]